MLQNLFNLRFRITITFILVFVFALIRNFEDDLFYDPLLNFFKGEFAQSAVPQIIGWKLYFNLFLRYILNSILSLCIIYVFFKNFEFLKVASFLYCFFFIVLIVLFSVVIYYFKDQLMLLFYVRRFIIQPILLLLFIPGFYFQNESLKKRYA